MQELPFLHSARPLMLIDICMKFRGDSLRGFQVTERTRFVTRQTDRRVGKNNMSPNPWGGDIMKWLIWDFLSKKACLQDFQPGKTQTGLRSYINWPLA